MSGIKRINPTILGIANNHIRDYGELGINETIEHLEDAGIQCVGYIKESVNKSHIVASINGIKIAVMAIAEHEFSVVETGIGAAGFEVTESYNQLKTLRNAVDYLIVLFHGGKEKYRYPTPREMRHLRYLSSAQPDLIIAQHSHCIGARETIGRTTIVYGQGNFHFCREENEYYDTSLLICVRLVLSHGSISSSIEYLPIEMVDGERMRLCGADDASDVLREFEKRSDQVLDDSFVQSEFNGYCDEQFYHFGKIVLGNGVDGTIFRVLNKLSPKLSESYFMHVYRKGIPGLLNSYRCETHNEMMQRILSSYYQNECLL